VFAVWSIGLSTASSARTESSCSAALALRNCVSITTRLKPTGASASGVTWYESPPKSSTSCEGSAMEGMVMGPSEPPGCSSSPRKTQTMAARSLSCPKSVRRTRRWLTA